MEWGIANETVSSIKLDADISQYQSINYTGYISNVTYSIEPIYSKLGMGFIHDFTHTLFDKYYTSDEDRPKGTYFTINTYRHISSVINLLTVF